MDWVAILTSAAAVKAAGVFSVAVLAEWQRRRRERAPKVHAIEEVSRSTQEMRDEIEQLRREAVTRAELDAVRREVAARGEGFERGLMAAGGTGPHPQLTDGRDRALDDLFERIERIEREREGRTDGPSSEEAAPEHLVDDGPTAPVSGPPRRR